MSAAIDYVVPAALIGAGATAVMDLWAVLRRKYFKTASLDYALVGRWLAFLARGRFFHDRISASPSVPGERALGWIAHYLIGIAFAALLPVLWGIDWVCQPTPGPALIVGFGSVAAPFLLMQPGMGFGIAANRTPSPAAARVRSLVTHGIFGLGLYFAALATTVLGLSCPMPG